MASVHSTYKIVIAGSPGLAKSCFLKRCDTLNDTKWKSINSVNSIKVTWKTTQGKISICLCAAPCGDEHKELRKELYQGAHAAIIILDTDQFNDDVFVWIREIREAVPDINIAVVLYWVKVPPVDSVPYDGSEYEDVSTSYFAVFTEACYDYEKPFIYLMRKLTHDDNLYVLLGL